MFKKVVGVGLLVLALLPLIFLVSVVITQVEGYDANVAEVGPFLAIGTAVFLAALNLLALGVLVYWGIRLIRKRETLPAVDLTELTTLELDYSNSRYDLFRFQQHYGYRSVGVWLAFAIVTATIAVSVGFNAHNRGDELGDTIGQMAVVVAFGITALVVFLFVYSLVVSFLRAGRRFQAPQRLVISGTNLTDEKATQYEWSSVRKVCCLTSYLLIYVARNRAFVIPARAFADKGAFHKTCAIVQALHERTHEIR